MGGKRYGYVRVSGADQNESRQMLAMKKRGILKKRIFLDKQSGQDFERPAYQRMLRRLEEGDTLFLHSVDRLGRNYKEIQEQWRILTKDIGVDLVVLDMPLLDTRKARNLLGTFVADLVLQVLSFVAENERDNIRTRQAEGIAAARKRGVRFGRPRRQVPSQFYGIFQLWLRGMVGTGEAARLTGLPRSTFYLYTARHLEHTGRRRLRDPVRKAGSPAGAQERPRG